MNRFLFILLLFSFPLQAEVIDLTHPFNDKTIYWPTADGFELKKVFWGHTEKGYFYSGNTFACPEHGGTHLDAPIHFAEGKYTVEKIPASQLVGQGVVIDLADRVKDQADYEISEADIREWEAQNGVLNGTNIVLFRTGWDRHWGNKAKYLGSDKKGDVKHLHFPGLSKEAAQYLSGKNIKGVGLDTASLDPGTSRDFWAHRVLLEKNIYGLENVAGLKGLPVKGFTLIVAPMKIEGGTGAPVRILALVNEK